VAALTFTALFNCGSRSVKDSGTGQGDGGPGELPTSLAFEPASTLALLPAEVRQIQVVASPAGAYTVRFALLPGDNRDPYDASLDRSLATTDAEGRASVVLRAPTTPTTFRVRASVGSTATAELAVSVSDSGYATVWVDPSYSGPRTISQWTASLRAGTTCAVLTGTPPPDGDLVAVAPPTEKPVINFAPVGPVLAITVRAGSFAGGCADAAGLSSGEVRTVSVSVTDRPMQIDQTDLNLAIGIDSVGTAWDTSMQMDIKLAVQQMAGGAMDDVAALLDAMQSAASTASADFQAARAANGWDLALRTALGPDAPTLLRAEAAKWMVAGAAKLIAPDTFQGNLTSAGALPQAPLLTLSSILGLNPDAAGFSPTSLTTFSAEPGDTVLLGAILSWIPSRMLTALSDPAARLTFPGAQDAADALAKLADCAKVGAILSNNVTTPGKAYSGCDAVCAEQLCRTALQQIWQRARDASGPLTATLRVSATGDAQVDDQARPVSIKGTWLGTFESAGVTAPVTGPLNTPPP
jgi:hypothetical protein